MADLAPFALMGLALVAAFAAQGLLLAAREHVRRAHPDWFQELCRGGASIRLAGPDDRARRRLARPLLFGRLPEAARRDPALRRLAERFRLAILALALGFGGLILIIAIRMHAPS